MSEFAKILVVDDEAELRDRFEKFLTPLGFHVVCIDPGSLQLDDLIEQITAHKAAKMVLLDAMISSRFDGGNVFVKLSPDWQNRVVAISEYLDSYIIKAGGSNYTEDFFGYKRHDLHVFIKQLEKFFTNPRIRERYSL